tara:strand:- start:404 stop:520 length:117 start_codon:yes stop_codon:yes gene_type:complete
METIKHLLGLCGEGHINLVAIALTVVLIISYVKNEKKV